MASCLVSNFVIAASCDFRDFSLAETWAVSVFCLDAIFPIVVACWFNSFSSLEISPISVVCLDWMDFIAFQDFVKSCSLIEIYFSSVDWVVYREDISDPIFEIEVVSFYN